MCKQISAATLITDGKRLLVGRVTGEGDRWDLPKGCIDEGESALETAVREVFEETGLRLDPANCSPSLGVLPYYDAKDLNVFVYLTDMSKIDIDSLVCTSTFYDEEMKMDRPEIDAFKIIEIDDIERYVDQKMLRCFDEQIRPRLERYIKDAGGA